MAKFTIDADKVKEIKQGNADKETAELRRKAYREESDPLVMEMIRGETDSSLKRVPTLEDIQSKIADIKQRYPKPNEVE